MGQVHHRLGVHRHPTLNGGLTFLHQYFFSKPGLRPAKLLNPIKSYALYTSKIRIVASERARAANFSFSFCKENARYNFSSLSSIKLTSDRVWYFVGPGKVLDKKGLQNSGLFKSEFCDFLTRGQMVMNPLTGPTTVALYTLTITGYLPSGESRSFPLLISVTPCATTPIIPSNLID